jgi:hypothetical protein
MSDALDAILFQGQNYLVISDIKPMTIEEIRSELEVKCPGDVSHIIKAIVRIRSEAYDQGWTDAEEEALNE